MSKPCHDYDQLIADWMTQQDVDHSTRPEDRMGFMRSGMESTLREAGLTRSELDAELANFDAAAMRFFAGETASSSMQSFPASGSRESESFTMALPSRLGIWGGIATVWVSLGLAVGSAVLVGGILRPLFDAGRIDRASMVIPAAIVAMLVLVAALLFVARLIRENRELGFMLFWVPLFLIPYGLVTGSSLLLQFATESMGPDFLPLAMPLAVLAGGALSAGSLWIIWRHFRRGRQMQGTGEPGPLHTTIMAAFMVIFFTIGAQKILEWGSGPSIVAGLLVTGILMRGLLQREVTFLFPLLLALPLALLAAELPASGLSALTVLVIALAAGAVISIVTLLRGARRTTLVSSLTGAALALTLVVAPSAPALRVSDAFGHPLEPMARNVMHVYDTIYRMESGRAVLSAITGFRSAAADARVDSWQLDQAGNRISLELEVVNKGEKGIDAIAFILKDAQELSTMDCSKALVAEHRFSPALWPDDREMVKIAIDLADSCPAADIKALSKWLHDDLQSYGSSFDIRARVFQTVDNDPKVRFDSDARDWLGL